MEFGDIFLSFYAACWMSNDVVDLEGKQQHLVDHQPGGDVHGHELLEQQLGSVG